MSLKQAEQQFQYGWQQYLSNKRGKDLAKSMKEFANTKKLSRGYLNPMHCLKIFVKGKSFLDEETINKCFLIAKELSPVYIGTDHHVIKLILNKGSLISSTKSINLQLTKDQGPIEQPDEENYWENEGEHIFRLWVEYAKNNGRGETSYSNTKEDTLNFYSCRKSAEKGFAKAQFILAVMYEQCYQTTRNYAKAEEWFLKAARQGLKEAQFYLGKVYEKGRGSKREIDRGIGIKRNIEQAIFWYERAKSNGHSDANQALARIQEDIEDINTQPCHLDPDPLDDIDNDKEILGLPKTYKDALVKSRIGQGKFREDLIDYWAGKCAVTGLKMVQLLKASHIKPWRISNNYERLDKFNGSALLRWT